MYYLTNIKKGKYTILDSITGEVSVVDLNVLLYNLNNNVEIIGCHKGTRGFRCRIYPNKIQREKINQTIGCCRKLWNEMLGDYINNYKVTGTYMKINEGPYKFKFPYMIDVDSIALQQSRIDLQAALRNYFNSKQGIRKGTQMGFPRFKSKNVSKESYRTNSTNNNIRIENRKDISPLDAERSKNKRLIIPQFNPSGKGTKQALKIIVTEPINGNIKNVTIERTKTNEYYASICCDNCWIFKVISEKEIANNLEVIGIDGGIKTYLTIDNGINFRKEKIEFDEAYSDSIKKNTRLLHKVQQEFSQTEKTSNNHKKIRLKIAKYHEKLRRTRQDYRHKITNKLSKESAIISIEDLNIKGMMQDTNHDKNRGFQEVSLYETYRQLSYKQEWRNHIIVKVSRTFASSQLCNICG